MNAGNIYIGVEAVYEKLLAQFKDVASKSEQAGKGAGKAFSDGFAENAKDGSSKIVADIERKLKSALGATAITNALRAALRAGAEGQDWKDAILAGIKSIPIVGPLTQAFEDAIKIATGRAEQDAERARAAAKQEQQREYSRQREQTAALERDDIAKRGLDRQEARLRKEIASAVDAEDKRLEARKKAELEVFRLARQRDSDLAKAFRDDRKAAIRQTYEDEAALVEQNLQREYRLIEQAEAEVAADRAKKDQERIAKQLEGFQKDISDLEQKRIDFGKEIGTTSTAFGTFRFAAYTDDEKKRVDQSILAEIRAIKDRAAQLASGGIS